MNKKIISSPSKHNPPKHPESHPRVSQGHCKKGHSGCNNGCKDLTLEQGVCPECKEKSLILFGIFKGHNEGIILLNSNNPNHLRVIKENVCPTCGCSLSEDKYCKSCHRKIAVLRAGGEIVCPGYNRDEKMAIQSGVCGKCERKIIFLNRNNPDNIGIIKNKLCPVCNGSLGENSRCERCNKIILSLYSCMGWCQQSGKYELHKNGRSENRDGSPLCIYEEDFLPAVEQKEITKKIAKVKV